MLRRISEVERASWHLLIGIPECPVAALADVLHAGADIQEQVSILGVGSPQRFQAENLQCLGKTIESLSILSYQRRYLGGLQLDPRSLRFGSGRSRFAGWHQQEV